MVFSSILFLFRFLPIAFLIYYLVPKKLKNFTLLVLSLVFYCWGEVRYFPIMVSSIVVDYVASNGIEKHRGNPRACKGFLLLSVFFNLGMLGFFKYTNFFIENINALLGTSIGMLSLTLPLGISFYTFQTMSYTIDVYRGKVEAEHNIIDFGAFVVLFPQLIAGPIVRYTDVARELKTRTLKLDRIESGVATFIMGLGRKVLIANACGVGILGGVTEGIYAGNAGDDDNVAAFEKCRGRAVTEAVDLIVYERVLFNVHILSGDVSLGLIIIVIGNEVFYGVFGEELTELGAKLCRECLVMS